MAGDAGAAERATLLAQLAADLRFILSDREVPESVQVEMARAGMKSLSVFVLIADDAPNLRTTLHAAPFNLDPRAKASTRQKGWHAGSRWQR